MTGTEPEFGELPPAVRSGTVHEQTAHALRERPGEWAKVTSKATPKAAQMLASQIRRGLNKAYRPDGTYEATDRGTDVWARYVGESS